MSNSFSEMFQIGVEKSKYYRIIFYNKLKGLNKIKLKQ